MQALLAIQVDESCAWHDFSFITSKVKLHFTKFFGDQHTWAQKKKKDWNTDTARSLCIFCALSFGDTAEGISQNLIKWEFFQIKALETLLYNIHAC